MSCSSELSCSTDCSSARADSCCRRSNVRRRTARRCCHCSCCCCCESSWRSTESRMPDRLLDSVMGAMVDELTVVWACYSVCCTSVTITVGLVVGQYLKIRHLCFTRSIFSTLTLSITSAYRTRVCSACRERSRT